MCLRDRVNGITTKQYKVQLYDFTTLSDNKPKSTKSSFNSRDFEKLNDVIVPDSDVSKLSGGWKTLVVAK